MLEENLPICPDPNHRRTNSPTSDERNPLGGLLVGTVFDGHELPALSDLVAAAVSLAEGTRHRVIVPMVGAPLELALTRRGDRVRIDLYGTESVPEVLMRDREVSLKELLRACERQARILAEDATERDTHQTMRRLAQLAARCRLLPDPHPNLSAVRVSAGAADDPGDGVPLAFGFEVAIFPSLDGSHQEHRFADVHALLFDGELWAFSRGKRISLIRGGPVMLVVGRMVAAMRALIDARRADRTANVRLCSGNFSIGVHLSHGDQVALTLGREGDGSLTLPGLDTQTVALPVLRLASDLIRALISADRTQARNLRVTSLRAEVRALRRLILTPDHLDGFVNRDPERLRLVLSDPSAPSDREVNFVEIKPGRLRFTERWSAEIDGLDAGATYLCGDRLVLGASRVILALCRDRGDVLWSHPAVRTTTFLTGRVLLRLFPNGELELRELEHGNVFARSRVTPRTGGPPLALFGGNSLPPLAVLAEGRRRLVAIDLRTGEPRWRFRSRGQGSLQLRRAGRLLLVVCGHGSIDALEIASGEVVWRHSEEARFCLAPAVCGETVVAVSGEPGTGTGLVFGIDLYSGRLIWRGRLEAAANTAPIEAGSTVLVSVGKPRHPTLVGLDSNQGGLLWTGRDPGIAEGGASLCVDRSLIINTPSGRICAVDADTGAEIWSRSLSNPLTDDVPRQLEPVLRHGALFVPSARVHVLRPSDGIPTTSVEVCDLVPDFLRVDERGSFYVAEESGHLGAWALVPQLSVVR